MKTLKDVSIVGLTVIAVIVMFLWAYYQIFVDTTTMGVNNIGQQRPTDRDSNAVHEDDMTDAQRSEMEGRWFMEAQYFSNENGNGEVLQELRFNYFTSHRMSSHDMRSVGMQYLGRYDVNRYPVRFSYGNRRERDNLWEQANNHVRPEFFYYNSTNRIS